DEDGVLIPQMTQGVVSTIIVKVAGDGYLSAWADFDGGGLFADGVTERIATDLRDDGKGSDIAAGDGQIEVDVLVPETSLAAQSHARFRWSSQPGLTASGAAPDGEVEDHTFVIVAPDLLDRGDAPASYGDATHLTVTSIYLGATPPDVEPLPQYSDGANADDKNGIDDDDDVVFDRPLIAGQRSILTVETHETLGLLLDQPIPPLGLVGVTNLQVFIDFDADGRFDAGEHVAIDYRDGGTGDIDNLFNNSISFYVDVPPIALQGPAIMRLRWSTTSGVMANPFDGQYLDGEVSDFVIPVQSATGGLSGVIYDDANGNDVLDDAEVGLGTNIDISIYDDAGTPKNRDDDTLVRVVQTNALGLYQVTDLPLAPTYLIEVDTKGGSLPRAATIGTQNPTFSARVIADGFDFEFDVPPSTLAGVLFYDNGASPHNGIMNPDEVGAALGRVTIFDQENQQLGLADIDGQGNWRFELPKGYSDPVRVVATASAGVFIVAENTVGLPGLINNDPYDGQVAFTPGAGQSYGHLDFGLLNTPRVTQDQIVQADAGRAAMIRHEYVAVSTGEVALQIVNMTRAKDQAAITNFLDVNCDGTPETVISEAISTSRGQRICFVTRVVATMDVGFDIVAVSTFDDVTLTMADHVTDLVQIVDRRGLLTLSKSVRNLTLGTPEKSANSGQAGDRLEYRIYLSNRGPHLVEDLSVFDATPPYTALDAPIAASVTLNDGRACNLVVPARPLAGYSGPLEWRCMGQFAPGDIGSVSFVVQIAP
ncbi:MAG: GEVED domain-containing protein, partial [Planktomarina sp.]